MYILIKLFFSFFKIGAFTFGGGYAMIPLMQAEIINTHHWLTHSEFMEIIAIAEMTPGPVAINSATFIGFRTAGVLGATIATLGVVLPSFITVLIIAHLLKEFKNSPWIKALFSGIKPAVIGLILIALFSLGQSTLLEYKAVLICLLTFFLLAKVKLHPITVIGLSALLGILFY